MNKGKEVKIDTVQLLMECTPCHSYGGIVKIRL